MEPSKTKDGLTFYPVPEFSDVEMAFGAAENRYFNRRSLPKVPAKFEDMAANLFYKGGHLPPLSPKVDKELAMRALRAWLSSFAPAHESKMATAGYALWVWSTDEALTD